MNIYLRTKQLTTAIFFLLIFNKSSQAVNYYTYQSGDWNAAFIWTTDPSGTTLVGSAPPGAGDNAFLLNGRTISSLIPQTVLSMSIQAGAVLDMGTTVGNSFGTVSGQGVFRLASSNFPAGTFTSFVSASGGTVEYYDFGGAGTNLPNQTTYNNLIISNSTVTNHKVIFPSAAPITYTINGSVTVIKSNTGLLDVVLATAANVINLNISGGLSIGTGCSFHCGLFNAVHNVRVGGDFINNGLVDLANDGQYIAAATGAANVIFTNQTNSILNCNGTTDVYTLQVNKGIDQTYILSVISSNVANFRLFSNGTSLVITSGTLKLNNNISITRITAAGVNWDISTAQNQAGGLWINGADFLLPSGCNAVVVYGKFRMSAGNFQIGQEGLVIRIAGEILFEGGTSIIEKYRSSTITGVHIGSFTMTGGTLTVDGSLTGGSNGDSPRFSHPFPGQSFVMTGGTINVANPETSTAANGGILIACDAPNINVTGGTWNITIPAAATNFNICSTAPFYNMNISKAGAGAGTVTLANQTIGASVIEVYRPNPVFAQPLVILNDLTLITGNTPILSALGQNVIVKRNFNLQASTTYTPGANTTIFNGSGPQAFALNGTISPSLNNLTIDKPLSRALNLTGSAISLTVNGNLTIITGTFADGNKTVNVNGNVINSGNHSGLGSITLTGPGAQTIGGTGIGKFSNLYLNKVTGTTSLNARQTVSGNLRLANTASILSLNANNLILGPLAHIYDALTGTTTVFSNTKMLTTSGNSSDGGLSKSFAAGAPSFTYPIGVGSSYTPGLLTFSGAPTAYGIITVRPVASEQVNVTTTGRCLSYYWRTTTSGTTLGAASFTQVYNYLDANVVVGAGITENDYVAAKYRLSNNSWISTTPAALNTTTNTITFTSAAFGTSIDGDYTAGDKNPIDPFGAVTVYYSIKNGNWDDVALATTPWSTVSNSGPAAGTIPGPNSPVQIGNGAGLNHIITVSNNNKTCGSIVIGNNSSLDLGLTTGHNLGTYTAGGIPAAGTLKISSATPLAEFPAGDFGNFLNSSTGGIMEYYTTGIVDFVIPSTSAAPSLAPLVNYRNLILKPAAAQIITMPNVDLTVLALTVNAPATSGLVQLNNVSSRTLTVNQNLNLNTGTIRYMNDFIQNIAIVGNAIIASNGVFDVSTAGAAVNNTLNIAGNLTNNGIFNMNVGSNRVANVTFSGGVNKSLTGTNVAAVTTLNLLTIDKGTSAASILTMDVLGTINTPNNNWLTLTNGTFNVSSNVNLTLTNAAAGIFTIPSTAALGLNNASSIINMCLFADDISDLFLAGKLEITNGTINIGTAANNNNNDIEYVAASNPVINIAGGILNVNGQIRRSATVTTGFLDYSQSGSSSVVIRGQNQLATRGKLEIVNPSSAFNMAGSSLLTIERGGGTTFGDLFIEPATSVMTGGTILFQQGNINTNQTYTLQANTPLYNVTVTGTDADDNATARVVVNDLTLIGSLSISNNFSVFNANSKNVSIKQNLTNLNTNASNGTAVGGYRAGSATQITSFNSNINNQTITGIAGNKTNFAQLYIDNTFAGGIVALAANTELRVNNVLTINEGTLNGNTNLITAINNVMNRSVHTSSGAGSITLAGSSLQFIDGDNFGVFGGLTINNATGAQAYADFRVNNALTLSNGILYIDSKLLTFGPTATVTGTFSATRLIRTNGAISDSGVVKIFNTGVSSFTYPIGVTGKYTPVTYNVTANGAVGTIQVRNVNAKHPATTDAAAKELNYYWLANATGFSGLTLTHIYNYINADVNGTEASYVTGRQLSNAWTPLNGIAGTVAAGPNTITLTGVNFVNGAYTAGESTEFGAITTLYSRNATLGGNWDDINTWSSTGHGGASAGVSPSFQNVEIAAGHTVNIITNFSTSSSLLLRGTLDMTGTIGNNFGIVTGNGRLRISTTASFNYVFPAGNYTAFIAGTTGGTVEYYSNVAGTLLPQQYFNHLEFTGSGQKNLTNVDLGVNGNLSILGGSVVNVFNRNIDIKENWVNDVSTTAFVAGTGTVRFLGANQTIGGLFSTNFYNLTSAGTAIKSLGINQLINNNLLISLGSTLDVTASNFAIDLKGNFTANGLFNARNGLVTLNGIAQQQIGGTSNFTFANVTLNNPSDASLNDNANISGTLNCSQGNFINNGVIFTLLSTSSATARIAPLVTGTYTGNITMQRFAPGPVTGWALIGAPVSNAKINQWTDDFPTSGFTGSTGNSGGFISIYYYDETVTGVWDSPTSYVPVTSANANGIIPGQACWVYLGSALLTTTDLTIDVTGPIIKGDFDFAPTYSASSGGVANDGWNLIANPYPSTIDWDAASGWNKVSMNNAIYVYQADLSQFATYIAGVGVNGGTNNIASSQGFFVKANAGSPELSCTELVKSAANPIFLKAASSATSPNVLRLKISDNTYADETAVRLLADASNSFDEQYDGSKLGSTNELVPYIATVGTENDYSINALSSLDCNYDIPVRVIVSANGTYQISFTGIETFNPNACLVFEDLYNGVVKDMRTVNTYTFDASDTTYAPRFIIHVRAALPAIAKATSCASSKDGSIIINNKNSKNQHINVINTKGNVVANIQSQDQLIEITDLPEGVYTINYPELHTSICGNIQSEIKIEKGLEVIADFSLANDTIYLENSSAVEISNTSSNATQYEWNFNNGETDNFEATPTVHYSNEGSYNITLTASNGSCKSETSNSITIINKLAQNKAPKISTTTDGANIYFDFTNDTQVELGVFNSSGQQVIANSIITAKQGNYFVNLNDFAKGVYFIHLTYNKETLVTKVKN